MINIYKDPWLPNPQFPQVLSMNSTGIEGVKVVDLLVDGGRCWDMEALQSLFSEDEMQYILKKMGGYGGERRQEYILLEVGIDCSRKLIKLVEKLQHIFGDGFGV